MRFIDVAWLLVLLEFSLARNIPKEGLGSNIKNDKRLNSEAKELGVSTEDVDLPTDTGNSNESNGEEQNEADDIANVREDDTPQEEKEDEDSNKTPNKNEEEEVDEGPGDVDGILGDIEEADSDLPGKEKDDIIEAEDENPGASEAIAIGWGIDFVENEELDNNAESETAEAMVALNEANPDAMADLLDPQEQDKLYKEEKNKAKLEAKLEKKAKKNEENENEMKSTEVVSGDSDETERSRRKRDLPNNDETEINGDSEDMEMDGSEGQIDEEVEQSEEAINEEEIEQSEEAEKESEKQIEQSEGDEDGFVEEKVERSETEDGAEGKGMQQSEISEDESEAEVEQSGEAEDEAQEEEVEQSEESEDESEAEVEQSGEAEDEAQEEEVEQSEESEDEAEEDIEQSEEGEEDESEDDGIEQAENEAEEEEVGQSEEPEEEDIKQSNQSMEDVKQSENTADESNEEIKELKETEDGFEGKEIEQSEDTKQEKVDQSEEIENEFKADIEELEQAEDESLEEEKEESEEAENESAEDEIEQSDEAKDEAEDEIEQRKEAQDESKIKESEETGEEFEGEEIEQLVETRQEKIEQSGEIENEFQSDIEELKKAEDKSLAKEIEESEEAEDESAEDKVEQSKGAEDEAEEQIDQTKEAEDESEIEESEETEDEFEDKEIEQLEETIQENVERSEEIENEFEADIKELEKAEDESLAKEIEEAEDESREDEVKQSEGVDDEEIEQTKEAEDEDAFTEDKIEELGAEDESENDEYVDKQSAESEGSDEIENEEIEQLEESKGGRKCEGTEEKMSKQGTESEETEESEASEEEEQFEESEVSEEKQTGETDASGFFSGFEQSMNSEETEEFDQPKESEEEELEEIEEEEFEQLEESDEEQSEETEEEEFEQSEEYEEQSEESEEEFEQLEESAEEESEETEEESEETKEEEFEQSEESEETDEEEFEQLEESGDETEEEFEQLEESEEEQSEETEEEEFEQSEEYEEQSEESEEEFEQLQESAEEESEETEEESEETDEEEFEQSEESEETDEEEFEQLEEPGDEIEEEFEQLEESEEEQSEETEEEEFEQSEEYEEQSEESEEEFEQLEESAEEESEETEEESEKTKEEEIEQSEESEETDEEEFEQLEESGEETEEEFEQLDESEEEESDETEEEEEFEPSEESEEEESEETEEEKEFEQSEESTEESEDTEEEEFGQLEESEEQAEESEEEEFEQSEESEEEQSEESEEEEFEQSEESTVEESGEGEEKEFEQTEESEEQSEESDEEFVQSEETEEESAEEESEETEEEEFEQSEESEEEDSENAEEEEEFAQSEESEEQSESEEEEFEQSEESEEEQSEQSEESEDQAEESEEEEFEQSEESEEQSEESEEEEFEQTEESEEQSEGSEEQSEESAEQFEQSEESAEEESEETVEEEFEQSEESEEEESENTEGEEEFEQSEQSKKQSEESEEESESEEGEFEQSEESAGEESEETEEEEFEQSEESDDESEETEKEEFEQAEESEDLSEETEEEEFQQSEESEEQLEETAEVEQSEEEEFEQSEEMEEAEEEESEDAEQDEFDQSEESEKQSEETKEEFEQSQESEEKQSKETEKEDFEASEEIFRRKRDFHQRPPVTTIFPSTAYVKNSFIAVDDGKVEKVRRSAPMNIRKKRYILPAESSRWDRGIVPFEFNPVFNTPESQLEQRAAMLKYQTMTCIRFVPNDKNTKEKYGLDHDGVMELISETGCWAVQGNTRGRQKNSCCGKIVCLHELGHTLGLIHEHQSDLRSGWIRINWANINPFYKIWFVDEKTTPKSSLVGYDITSNMHYSMHSFSANGKPVMTQLYRGPQFKVKNSDFYTNKEISLAHKCGETYCSDFDVECVNEGYLTLIRNECSCSCPPGLEPTTGCADVKKQAVMKMWPKGTYSIIRPAVGCPKGLKEGNVVIHATNSFKSPFWHLGKGYDGPDVEFQFCTSDEDNDSDVPWEPGVYCILRKGGKCPAGFIESFIQYGETKPPKTSGVVPDGVFDKQTRLFFCCRSDGFETLAIRLPNTEPFALVEHGATCQIIAGMGHQEEYLVIQNKPMAEVEGIGFPTDVEHPKTTFNKAHGSIKLQMCYYHPITSGCGDIIELNDDHPSTTITSPGYPENYPNNIECNWLIKGSDHLTIKLDFEEFDVEGTIQCLDYLEIRQNRIGQIGVKYCGSHLSTTIMSVYNNMSMTFRTNSENTKKGFKAKIQLVRDKDYVYNPLYFGSTYRGKINFTHLFEPCIPWAEATHCEHHPLQTGDYEDDLIENYCRNPDKGIMPWCYTSNEDCSRNYCDVSLIGKLHNNFDDCEEVLQEDPDFCKRDIALQGCGVDCSKVINIPKKEKSYLEVSCKAPENIKDSELIEKTKTSYKEGDAVTYKCKTSDLEYKSTCMSDGSWTPVKYVCGGCPYGWVEYKNDCYKYYDTMVKIKEAKRKCAENNATLTTVLDQDEEDFLVSLRKTMHKIMIGLEKKNGKWVWPDESVATWLPWERPPFDRWDYKYAILLGQDKGRKWVATNGYWRREFVCKRSIQKRATCLDRLNTCEQIMVAIPRACQNEGWSRSECPVSCNLCQVSDKKCDVGSVSEGVKQNGTVNSLKIGEYVSYYCDSGYVFVAGNKDRVCLKSGKLSGEPYQCKLATTLPSLSNNVPLSNYASSGWRGWAHTGMSEALKISVNGEIAEWQFYSRTKGQVAFLVFRPTESPLTMDLIGRNIVKTRFMRKQYVTVKPAERITVKAGDVLGLYPITGYGIPMKSGCSGPKSLRLTTYLWNSDSISIGNTYTFVQEGQCKLWAFRAKILPIKK